METHRTHHLAHRHADLYYAFKLHHANVIPERIAEARCRFSKTARSRPRHNEARRSGRHASSLAELRRRFAHDVAESAAERTQAAEPDVQANVCHAPIRGAQKKHRALDAPALEIAMRGLAESSEKVRMKCASDTSAMPASREMHSGSANVRSIASLARSIRRLHSSSDRFIKLLYPPRPTKPVAPYRPDPTCSHNPTPATSHPAQPTAAESC